MRRLGKAGDDERGATSIIVALLMVVLLGFGALAVDVGMLYSEHVQLRNGSDAAAFAVAQRCAHNPAGANCSTTSPLAQNLVNTNAGDGLSNLKSIVLDKTRGTVQVITGAQESGKEANRVSLLLARALGFSTAEVTAGATVQWGRPVAGPMPFPLAFSVCQVKDQVDGSPQLLQYHGVNANADCMYGPSGAAVQGGFGWLTSSPGTCGGRIDIRTGDALNAPGNSYPGVCDAVLGTWVADITAGKDVIVLLPVYNQVTGTGTGATYKITAFVALKVIGWNFSGSNTAPVAFRNKAPFAAPSLSCDGNCRGIIGTFVRYASLGDGYVLGATDDYGANVIRLIK